MRFLSLELKGYKRLALNKIEYIRINFQEKTQLIIGSNGSGKSSILKELSPLPATFGDSGDFYKTGHKIVTIEHAGQIYTLRSHCRNQPKHSCLVGNEELNPGGTGQVQKDLCEQLFKITPTLHDVFVGIVSFHAMSVSQRRSWFTTISQNDYVYALSVYQSYKESLRDLQGGIRIAQARLVKESSQLIEDSALQSIETDIAQLKAFIDDLINQKRPSSIPASQLKDRLNHSKAELIRLNRLYQDTYRSLKPLTGYANIADIRDRIVEHQTTISLVQKQNRLIGSKTETQQELYHNLTSANVSNLDDITSQISETQHQITEQRSRLLVLKDCDDPVSVQQAFKTVQRTIVELFSQLEPDPDRQYTREHYDRLVKSSGVLVDQLKTRELERVQLSTALTELDHLREHNQIECPQCRHQWIRGYDPQHYTAIEQQLVAVIQAIEVTQSRIETTTTQLESTKSYLMTLRQYREIVQHWGILAPLWDAIQSSDLLKHPQQALSIIERSAGDIPLLLDLQALRIKLADLTRVRDHISTDSACTQSSLATELEELQRQYAENQQQIHTLESEIQRLQQYHGCYTRLTEITQSMAQLIQTTNNDTGQAIEIIRSDILNQLIQTVQLDVVEKERRVSQSEIQKSVVAALDQQIADLTEESRVIKIIIDELSPTTGLIAKSMMAFINVFVEQMNLFIEKIWLYPLVLIPIEPDDDSIDLDFKFQVRINDDMVISDITKCSSAMREVIDLAFRVISMVYLGLVDYPIYLDEFGHSMDHEHRRSAFKAIDSLVNSSDFSQVFLVSHFENCYGSLKHTEVTVLCDANIVIPEGTVYNQHVEIS